MTTAWTTMTAAETATSEEALERLGALLLGDALGRLGLDLRHGRAHGVEGLARRLGVAPRHDRLFDALIAAATNAGLAYVAEGRLIGLSPSTVDLAEEKRVLRDAAPAAAPHMDLLEAATEAYPEVLTGRQEGLAALFPGGSSHLVEPIYRHDPVTRHFNARLADLVGAYVRARHAADPTDRVTLLEVGAGTGGTSAEVLAALDRIGGPVRYLYTDLSDALLAAARERFAPGRGWLEVTRLDLETDLEAQGIAADSVDVAFGTNVVHATRRIDATLARLKRVLHRNGLLLVSEATRLRPFSTLTFGLTDGWWAFEDRPIRLPHGPLLSAAGWTEAFARAGFRDVVAVDESEGAGWSLIAGESDGRVEAAVTPSSLLERPAPRPPAPLAADVGTALAVVQEVFAATLKFPADRLDPNAGVETFGVDSLLVLKLTRALEAKLGRLPASLLFERTTIREVADWVARHRADRLGRPAGAAPDVVPAPPPASAAPAPPARDDAVAIVGLSGRYPGAETLDRFWHNLHQGRCAIGEPPAERWDWRQHAAPCSGARWGGFIAEIDRFDPLFFRIAPREAAAMDPQERLFLEHAWWALEDAGYTRAALRREVDARVGVFAGAMNCGYEWLGAQAEARGSRGGAHVAHWSVANRVSYVLDLSGPSLAVDTACSSSLTALHLACESLRRGECRMALAGGVNLILHPGQLERLDRLGMLSENGRCSSFGAEAAGMVDAEGVGVALLRPLKDAVASGDRVLAVILGSAINAGGRTSGYTVPNPAAQAAVIAQAHARAGIAPESVSYVEAHGTGTTLGDPIEIAGLARAWGAGAARCLLGSVKSNIGHAESAAAIAGLTKIVLQMRHRTIVPSLGADPPNPGILFEETPFEVARAARPWTPAAPGLPLRAGLSSFGAGGANGHLVVEEFGDARRNGPAPGGPQTLLLSAADPQRLAAVALQLADRLAVPEGTGLALADVAYTLKVGREALPARAAIAAATTADAAALLRALADGRPVPPVADPEVLRWLDGEDLDWPAAPPAPGRPIRVGLPGYPFARERHWIEDVAESPPLSAGGRGAVAAVAHPDPALMGDHVLDGVSTLPGTAFCTLAWSAVPAQDGPARHTLLDVSWSSALRGDGPAALALDVADQPDGTRTLRFARSDDGRPVAAMRLGAPPAKSPAPFDVAALARHCPREIDVGLFYRAAAEGGLAYGPMLRVVTRLWIGEGEALGHLARPDGPAGSADAALLDGVLQVAVASIGRDDLVPAAVDRLAAFRPFPPECLVRVVHRPSRRPDAVVVDADLADMAGHPIARIEGALLVPARARRADAAVHEGRDVEEPRVRRAWADEAREIVRATVAEAIGLEAGRIRDDVPLDSYGLDSVLMVSVIARLEAAFGPQSKTLFFEYPTLNQVADHLAPGLRTTEADAPAPAAAPASAAPLPRVKAPPAPRSGRDDAIAIVGLAARFPGEGADGTGEDPGTVDSMGALDAFWKVLAEGVDAVREIPGDRWDWRDEGFFRPDVPSALATGRSYARWGGFLGGGIDRFDALHFGISPREAELMDPQERMFLEVAWHALEHAGYGVRSLAGAAAGVFVGAMFGQYQMYAGGDGTPNSSFASIANRVSHAFDWRGPSLAVDTMCSSSLTAIDLAVQALARREIDVAIAGGVNLITHPARYLLLSQARFLSTDGRCRAFGDGGDGYVPGEGAGAIVLKRAADARAAGDTVLATVLGSAMAHGGRSAGSGFTVPSPAAQGSVIAKALAAAAIDPASVGYVEAHGTGTSLGDPVEVAGLTRAYGDRTRPLPVGSVKSNVGHLESAAGMAGLTKLLLQFAHGQLAPSLLHDPEGRLNAHIDFAATPFHVQRVLAPWHQDAGSRRAGLSSFGAGGSNVHLVIEEGENAPPAPAAGPEVVPLSAPTPGQLRTLARLLLARLVPPALSEQTVRQACAAVLGVPADAVDLRDTLEGCGFDALGRVALRDRLAERAPDVALPTVLAPDLPLIDHVRDAAPATPALGDVAFTLQAGRDAFEARMAFVVDSLAELCAGLRAVVEGGPEAAPFHSLAAAPGAAAAPPAADLAALAAAWVAGAEVRWPAPKPGRRRVALPGCPFRRTRHWIALPATTDGPAPEPHPLLGTIRSTLSEHRSALRLDALPWLADHRLNGRAVLPAAAAVEIVRAAAVTLGAASPVMLRDLRWRHPLALAPATLVIAPDRDGAAFAIRQGAGEEERVAVEGRIARGSPVQVALPLGDIAAACGRALDPALCYDALAAIGLDYGAAFRPLRRLAAGDGEVLGELELAPGLQGSDALEAHPALIDGALQALLALRVDDPSASAAVPVGMDTVTVMGRLPPRCVVHAVARGVGADRTIDLSMATPGGDVRVRIDGLVLHAADPPPVRPAKQVLWFRPVWRPERMKAPVPEAPLPVLLVGAGAGLASALRRAGVEPVLREAGDGRDGWRESLGAPPLASATILRMVVCGPADPPGCVVPLLQGALAARQGRKIVCAYVYADDDPRGPAHAGIAGLARSLAMEETSTSVVTLRHARRVDADRLAGQILAALDGATVRDVQIDGEGHASARGIEEIEPPQATEPPWPPHPVVVVTGGAGGIGALVAEHLAGRHGARLLLVGRSAPGHASAVATARVRAAGGECHYLAADVATADGARAAVDAALTRFGRLDGIVHSAGITRDRLFRTKDLTDFRAVVGPKLAAVEHLDHATRAVPLTVFAVFSSVTAELGNLGQTDYAYANRALDAFAHRREAERGEGLRQGRCRVIAWPLWRDGGMRIGPEALARARAMLGMDPLETAAALKAFDRALLGPEVSTIVIAGDAARLRARLGTPSDPRTSRGCAPEDDAAATPTASVPDLLPAAGTRDAPPRTQGQAGAHVKPILAEVLRVPLAQLGDDRSLERFGVDSIAAAAIADRLRQALGVEVATSAIYEERTVGDLVARIDALRGEARAAEESVREAPDARREDPPLAADPARAPVLRDAPIAIIGLAGRYPLASDVSRLWANLAAGRDCLGPAPEARWPGDGSPRWGGFIDDVDAFDPLFFRIAPGEAATLDPQVRLLLETAWHAIEDAGQSRARLRRLEEERPAGVGVFVASMHQHYPFLADDPATGVRLSSGGMWSLANRLSHAFDLHGPSLALDSACSGSLSAIHLACESLRGGDCAMALAGGINLTLHPGKFASLADAGMLGSGRESRSLGQGDGFIPGEGVGIAVLKPLSSALADGDRVLAVLRGSAINHGGRNPGGFTAPSGGAQASLVERALARSGVAAASIDYVEAAANGSPLGDAVEFTALTRAFRRTTDAVGFCAIGSIKSNIGHLEAASGISQLTKVVLQLNHGRLAPTLHAEPPNPAMALGGSPFRIQSVLSEWPGREGAPRCAGVCSLGGGGSGAFVVVEEAPPAPPRRPGSDGTTIFPVSAMASDRLDDAVRRLAARLREAEVPDAADLAFTLQARREAFDHRAVFLAESTADLLVRLEAFGAGDRAAAAAAGVADPDLADLLDARQCVAMRHDGARLATLWAKGLDVPWEELFWTEPARPVSTPGYPFARRRFWIGTPSAEVAAVPQAGGPATVESRIRALVGDLLRMAPGDIETGRDLAHYGFDSLLGVQLTHRLRDGFGAEVSIVDLFERLDIASIARRVTGARSRAPAPVALPAGAEEAVPLTPGQAAMWHAAKLAPGHAAHNLPCGFRIRSEIDEAALADAFRRTVARHPVLFLRVTDDGAGAVQHVPADGRALLRIADLPGPYDEASLTEHLMALGRAPFDLAAGPLCRGDLLRLPGGGHALLLTFHHMAFDGISLTVILNDLTRLYVASRAGCAPALEPLGAGFLDFARWQRGYLAGEGAAADRLYWRSGLRDAPAPVELPLDGVRTPIPSYRGEVVTRALAAERVAALKRLALGGQVNLFTLLCCAFASVLWRETGRADLLLGTPFAGRPDSRFVHAVGFFANIVPLRIAMDPEAPFGDMARALRGRLLEAIHHGSLPFQEIAAMLKPGDGHMPGTPPLKILFGFQNWATSLDANTAEYPVPGEGRTAPIVLETIEGVHQTGEFDLMLSMVETEGGCLTFFKYDAALFEHATIDRVAERLDAVLARLEAAGLAASPAALAGLTEAERDRLTAWSGTATPYPRDATLPALFAAVAKRHAGCPALVSAQGICSYAALDIRANRLANLLHARGIGTGDAVALLFDRSPDFVVALLATLKCGAFYVPLDPNVPPARLRALSAGTVLALADRPIAADLGTPVLTSAEAEREAGCFPDEPPPASTLDAGMAAYVMFTSGSTGVPKGVIVPHRAVVRLVCGTDYVGLGTGDRVLGAAALGFDGSTWEIWGALLNGAALHLAPPRSSVPDELAAFMDESAITHAFLPTGLFEAMGATAAVERLGTLRVLIVGGDVAPPAAIRRFRDAHPGCRLLNAYGPTENTTFSTVHVVPDRVDGPLPIGRPIANSTCFILDADGSPVPAGAWGELHVGGDGLALGYWNDPELTRARFVPQPAARGARLYRTGDRARWRVDGEIEFGGRLDQQVKIRGYRVELAEIETALAAHPGIAAAIVAVRGDGPASRSLVAGVVSTTADRPAPHALARWLRERLPDYMVPALIIGIDALPLGPTGKADRRALIALAARAVAVHPSAGPDTVADRIARVFERVLELEPGAVTPDDDFFERGGHSLLAGRVVAELNATFGSALTIAAFYADPRPAGLATQACAPEPVGADGPAAGTNERIPLSSAQERLWFLFKLEPTNPRYVVPCVTGLRGTLAVDALGAALTRLVGRHESLRTRYLDVDGVPEQVVDPAAAVDLPLVDLSTLPPSDAESEARRWVEAEVRRPFDLARGPVLRPALIRVAHDHHVLALLFHHIAVDAVSITVLFDELQDLYAAATDGTEAALPLIPIRFVQHVVAQRAWLSSAGAQAAERFWRAEVAGAPGLLHLPLDRPRPAVARGRGGSLSLSLDEGVLERLRVQARRHKATLFTLLLTAAAALLHRWTGEDDLCLGCPVSGREHRDEQRLVGLFVNTVVLRSRLGARDEAFAASLGRMRTALLGALSQQTFPFERIVDLAGVERVAGANPLVQVLVSHEVEPSKPLRLGDAAGEPFAFAYEDGKFDLALGFREGRTSLVVAIDYDRDLFDRSTIDAFARRLEAFLGAVADRPDIPVCELPLLLDGEGLDPLDDGGEAVRGTAPDAMEAIRLRADARPDHPAVIDSEGTTSYAALVDRTAAEMARLRAAGVVPGDRVGVCLERSAAAVAAVIGIWQAGAIYVPLEAALPAERLRFMLDDAGIGTVVANVRTAGLLAAAGFAGSVLHVGAAEADTAAAGPSRPHSAAAYIIYTSGSTGEPKGVVVTHANLAHLCSAASSAYALRAEDRILHFANPAFDVAIEEVFSTLCAGATLVAFPPEAAPDAAAFARFVEDGGLSVLNLPTAYWHVLAAAGVALPRSVRLLIVGGEPARADLLRRWRTDNPSVTWINAYGPTEATVTATTFALAPDAPAPDVVPIGRPLPGVRAYVLDEGQLVPSGTPGELHLAGAGVAAGYWRRPEQTAARFVPDPFSADPGARLYRTGDRARWTARVGLEFLGRLDHQVKLRGHRIELGEIEHRLMAEDAVTEAAVACHRTASGDDRLVAYVLFADRGTAPAPERLRARLADALPSYMVPSVVLPVPDMPRTSGGKIDRGALARRALPDVAPADATPSTSPLERSLVALWRDLLGRDPVDAGTDFFQAGGHSLLAVQLAHRVSAAVGRPVEVAALLRHRTPRALAQALVVRDGAEATPCLDLLRPGDASVPLILAPGGDGQSLSLLGLAQGMNARHAVFAFRTPGLAGEEAAFDDMGALAGRYVREIVAAGIREAWIGGWSMGGVVALELARQLPGAGVRVAGLIAIDGFLAEDVRSWRPELAESPAAKVGVLESNEAALFGYTPAFRLDVDLHYVRPSEDLPSNDRGGQARRWQTLVGRPIRWHAAPGDHFTMLLAPHVAVLAGLVDRIVLGEGFAGP